MAKKSKAKFNFLKLLPIACGILAIAMFFLVFLKETGEGSLFGLASGKYTYTMTGWSLIFGTGEVNYVIETSSVLGNTVKEGVNTNEDIVTAALPLIGFICIALATVFSVLVLFAPKKCHKASYLLSAALFVGAVILVCLSQNSFVSANEEVTTLFKDGAPSLGVCFSSFFALGGAATSVLALKK